MGLAFEPGLVDRILKDITDEPGALPLLEYVLTAVWSADSQTITQASYEKAGGVAGSIAEAADNVYQGLTKDEQEACQQLFTRLVHVTAVDVESADTRQVVRRSQLLEIHWEIARRFADSGVRLLVMGRNRSEETIEVAHEQLIRSWPRLCNWMNENRDFLLWRAHLGAFIETWRKLGSGNNGLLEGRELRVAQQWLRRKTRDLNKEERTFILKGSSRKRISRAAVALIAVAVLSTAVWAGYQQTDYAQIRAAIADANYRVAQISDPRSRSDAQSALAEALAKAGRMQQAGTLFEEAQKAAGQNSEPVSRSHAQSALALALAEAGKFQQARSLAR